MKKIKIAIVGGSGLVGENIVKVLKDECILDFSEVTLYVSKNSAGKKINYFGNYYDLVLLDENSLKEKYDIVFFSAGDDVSKNWAERFSENGAFVIDNSNAFRKEKNVPLIVPEINIEKVNKNTKIISNPNCSTIQLTLATKCLLEFAKSQNANLEKIVVSTYQSVSGAGRLALFDLENETNLKIKEPIKNNVLLKIGDIEDNDFCKEENKIMFELCKILDEKISVCASTVRVPISHCHSESVYAKFSKNVDFSQINGFFDKEYLNLQRDIVLPTDVYGKNKTYICRLRKFSECETTFFVIADNLLRGASYNAVLIAKYIIFNLLT